METRISKSLGPFRVPEHSTSAFRTTPTLRECRHTGFSTGMALEFRTTTTRLPWETTPATPYRSRLRDSLRFRVVRVAQGDWDDPVRCFLIQRELSAPADGGPYKALSYVWGSPRVKDTIYIDGLSIQVTLNLFCALKYLRHANMPGEDLIVWVDALVSCEYSVLSARAHQSIPLHTHKYIVHQSTGSRRARKPG